MTIRLIPKEKSKNNIVQPNVLGKNPTHLHKEHIISAVSFPKKGLRNKNVETYYGQDAINKLIALNVLKPGQSTCRNLFKTTAEKLWVNDGNNGHNWVDAELVKCAQFLFWQIGINPPQCSSCTSWYNKHDESEITIWYQTKERNFNESISYLFTHAEKLKK